jgi:hypothetical protein
MSSCQLVPHVRLSCDGEWVPVSSTTFIGIQEDMVGRDVLTYLCPECNTEHSSHVILVPTGDC